MPESQCNEVFEFDRTLKGKMSVKRTPMRDLWGRRLDAASQRKTAHHEGRLARLSARTLPGLLQKPKKGGQQGLLGPAFRLARALYGMSHTTSAPDERRGGPACQQEVWFHSLATLL